MSDAAVPARRKGLRISPGALPYVLSLPALLVCIGILVPFFTAVAYSLQRYRLSQPWARRWNWGENYWNFLSDSSFWNTLNVSLTYAVLTVGLELVLGLCIALLLQERTRFNNFVSIMLLMPLMTAPALASLMWKLMTNPGFGILSYFASLIGFEDFRWASDPSTAMLTVVLVDMWVYTPFIMILLLAGLRSLPRQPFEAAALDGVPRLFVFWRITLPMLTPYLLTATLFRVIESGAAVRHNLRDDPGRPGRQADRVPGGGVPELLPVNQCRALGGPADDSVGDHLRALDDLHQAVAETARTPARGGLSDGPDIKPREGPPQDRDLTGDPVLHVPDILDRAHELPDERDDPSRAAVGRLRAHPLELRRARHRPA